MTPQSTIDSTETTVWRIEHVPCVPIYVQFANLQLKQNDQIRSDQISNPKGPESFDPEGVIPSSPSIGM